MPGEAEDRSSFFALGSDECLGEVLFPGLLVVCWLALGGWFCCFVVGGGGCGCDGVYVVGLLSLVAVVLAAVVAWHRDWLNAMAVKAILQKYHKTSAGNKLLFRSKPAAAFLSG